jgi:hypothetical protein
MPGSTRLPRAETLHAIARTNGVSLDWLLGLIASDALEDDKVPSLEIQTISAPQNSELLSEWHKQATGYKIRYVPASLPDLLRTEAVNQIEFSNYSKTEIAAKEEASRYQLTYLRRPETDMEICMPLQTLEQFARGESIWKEIDRRTRKEQLEVMAELVNEMYPTLRLFLFDQRELYVSPYTVFGPKRAAIYLGNMYLVVNSADHIKSLTRHFDSLIRISKIGPDRITQHIRGLIKTLG